MQQEEIVFNETPQKNEVIWGLFLGLGYFTILPIIPLLLLILIFGSPVSGSINETFLSAIAQVITAFIVAGLMIIVSKRAIPAIKRNFSVKSLVTGLKYAVIAYFAVISWSIIDELIFGPSGINENQGQVEIIIKNFPATGIIFTVLAAPIIEEITYRYYLYKGLEKKNIILAFIVTVFSFAAMHLIPSIGSGTLLTDLRSLPAYLLASFIFTFAYYKSKKISVAIFAHMIYNGFAVIMLFASLA